MGRTSWTNKDLYISVNRNQPRITINDFTIDIYPAFHLEGYWPKSGRKQFLNQRSGQSHKISLKIDLVSKEIGSTKPYSTDRDAWYLDFLGMENQTMKLENRRLCFEVIRSLISQRLSPMSPLFDPVVVRTIFMYICEKQSGDALWANDKLPDRINAFLLQLVASLQNQCLPHFFLRNLNLLDNQSTTAVQEALIEAWKLTREFCTNPYLFEEQLQV